MTMMTFKAMGFDEITQGESLDTKGTGKKGKKRKRKFEA